MKTLTRYKRAARSASLGILIVSFFIILFGWHWFIAATGREGLLNATMLFFDAVAGLAIFLLGMKFLSSGLQDSTADQLKKFLAKWSKNTYIGVFVGFFTTALLQSSSATTVIVVGFVNASIMSLKQAIAMVMGANIGTTITGQLISFDLQKISLPMLSLGIFIYLFSKRETSKYIGKIIGGFGLLFFGLNLMKHELGALGSIQWIRDTLVLFSAYPLLGILSGAIFTVLVQSSSAALGITIALSASGAISLQSALPLIIGLNVGTTLTANLAALHGSNNARRVARTHSVFNVLGATIFFFILPLFEQASIAVTESDDVARQIANAHTLFNVSTVILFIPFISMLHRLSFWLIPKSSKEAELDYLEKSALDSPAIALDQAEMALKEMFLLSQKVNLCSRDYLMTFNERKGNQVISIERKLDRYHSKILTFLSELSRKRLTDEQASNMPKLIQSLSHIEQIGDLGEQIHIAGKKMRRLRKVFTTAQKRDIRKASKYIDALFKLVHKTFTTKKVDASLYQDINAAYAQWSEFKNTIIAERKSVAKGKKADLARINYYLDVMLTYNEIAKKCRGIVWEELHSHN